MGNPFESISNSISDFAGDISDAWSGKKSPLMSSSKYLSYPYSLGDNSSDDIIYNSDFDGDSNIDSMYDSYAEARANSSIKSDEPFILFEFITTIDEVTEITKINNKISEINNTEATRIKSNENKLIYTAKESGSEGNKRQVHTNKINDLNERKKLLEKKIGRKELDNAVALYMTPAINITDQINYDQESRKLAAAWDQFDSSDFGLDGDTVFGFSGDDATIAGTEALPAIAAGTGAWAGKALDKIPFIKKMGISSLIGGAGLGVGAKVWADEYLRRIGKVLNPNEYMQYKTTQLRTFSFNWKFLPDSETESLACKEIIKVFRAAAHADRKSSVTLKVPDQVVVSFHGVEGLINLPTTVISNVSVTYNPNASSFFKHSNMPVEIDLTVTLNEIMPIYKDDVLEDNY